MPGVKDGTIIQGPDGFKIAKGGQWQPYAGALPKGIGSPTGGGGGGVSATDAKELNTLSQQAQSAEETRRVYEQARGAVHRLKTGPMRGTLLDTALPGESTGILSSLGDLAGQVIGSPMRALGYIDNHDVSDYQTLQRLKQANVLTRQMQQKGVQTEGDAARIGLTEISPRKTVEVNDQIIDQGIAMANRARARAVFMNQWAHKYGLHSPREDGAMADQVWQQHQDQIVQKLFPQGQNTAPVIRRVR